jgi:hypothetical protein
MSYPRVATPFVCLALLAACNGDDSVNTGTGSINVVVNPPSSPFDPDGYQARIDNGSPKAVPEQGLAIPGVFPGDHQVQLTDVDLPCRVTSANPKTVTVTGGDVATAAFTVLCETTGFIHVTTHTTGEDPDPDGYALAVDGADAPLIGANATSTLLVDAGVHDVTISEIADNCSVPDDTIRVTVDPGGDAFVTFEVVCTAVP